MSNGKPQREILETALLAGQIMCESNAESYRVEDTMNRILTLSKASYAVAVSFSTSIYAVLDDPSYESGSYTGIKRITTRSNNLNKISQVNAVSRELIAGELTTSEALTALAAIRSNKPQYNSWWQSVGIILMAISFTILFGGGVNEVIAGLIDGIMLAIVSQSVGKYFLNDALQNIVQAMIVTIVSYLLQHLLFPTLAAGIVITATLMPMVPGTAITNAFRDIFREDYIAGGARAMEAFFVALMIAIGSLIGLTIIQGAF
ncbi:MAG: threonine/serine exporter family protein [Aerococcus sp.]|nr:threonine/serine exporter family protein [Aerococcus sp.]